MKITDDGIEIKSMVSEKSEALPVEGSQETALASKQAQSSTPGAAEEARNPQVHVQPEKTDSPAPSQETPKGGKEGGA